MIDIIFIAASILAAEPSPPPAVAPAPAAMADQFPAVLATTTVLAHGAKADGTTDDTAAFQAALDATAPKGGVALVPAGTYRIDGALDVPQGVTLRGVWEAPHQTDIGKGTILHATGSAGKEDGPPLVTLNQSSCLRGVTIYYPDQRIDDPKPYPWTVQGKGMHVSVIDVTLSNPWKGIDVGTHWNECHLIRNVFGCPLRLGVYINNTTDIGRVENVHFNPNYWTRAAHPNAAKGDMFGYLSKNLVGFLIGRTDWEYLSNCFVIFPRIGFHFVRTPEGMPNAVLAQCGSDICPVAVQVDACQEHAGISFVNGQFMGTAILGPANRGPVKFTSCGFWPIDLTDHQALVDGAGSLTLTACHFAGWGRKDPGAACILVKAGSLTASGCEFFEAKKGIELGPGTRSAAVFGCRFRGGAKIENKAPAGASIQVGFNVD
jgi:hypothetical protein